MPLERGAHAALVFNSGMAAIMTALFTFVRPATTIVYTVPIYGGTQHFIQDFLHAWGSTALPCRPATRGQIGRSHSIGEESAQLF